MVLHWALKQLALCRSTWGDVLQPSILGFVLHFIYDNACFLIVYFWIPLAAIALRRIRLRSKKQSLNRKPISSARRWCSSLFFLIWCLRDYFCLSYALLSMLYFWPVVQRKLKPIGVNDQIQDMCPTDTRVAHHTLASAVQVYLDGWMKQNNYTITVFPWAISAIAGLRWGANKLRTEVFHMHETQSQSERHLNNSLEANLTLILKEFGIDYGRHGDFVSDFDLDLQFTGQHWGDEAEHMLMRNLRDVLRISIPGVPESWFAIPRCVIGRKPTTMFGFKSSYRRNQFICFSFRQEAPLYVWFNRPEWPGYRMISFASASVAQLLDIAPFRRTVSSLLYILDVLGYKCGDDAIPCNAMDSVEAIEAALKYAIWGFLNPFLARIMAFDFWIPHNRSEPAWKPDFSSRRIKLSEEGWLVPEKMPSRLLSQLRTGFGKYLSWHVLQPFPNDLLAVRWQFLSRSALDAISDVATRKPQYQTLWKNQLAEQFSSDDKKAFVRSLSELEWKMLLSHLPDDDKHHLVFCRVLYRREGRWPEDADDVNFQLALNGVVLPACQAKLEAEGWLNFASSFGCL